MSKKKEINEADGQNISLHGRQINCSTAWCVIFKPHSDKLLQEYSTCSLGMLIVCTLPFVFARFLFVYNMPEVS